MCTRLGIWRDELIRDVDTVDDLDAAAHDRVVLHIRHRDEFVDSCHAEPVQRVRHQLLEAHILKTRRPSEVIRGTQRPSEVIRDHTVALRGTQNHSVALRRHSEGTQRALSARCTPPLARRTACKHPVPHICSPTLSLTHSSPRRCVPRAGREYAPSLGRCVQLIGGGGAGAPRGVPGGRLGDERCTPPLPPCRVDERP